MDKWTRHWQSRQYIFELGDTNFTIPFVKEFLNKHPQIKVNNIPLTNFFDLQIHTALTILRTELR